MCLRQVESIQADLCIMYVFISGFVGTGETSSGRPFAYFNTSVETGPRIVPSMLFQLPEKISADSYIDLVRRIVQAVSAVAVTPQVVFECLDGGTGQGEHFSILWKDEHGQLHTQAIAVEDTHEAAWRLIGRLQDRLGCSPQFVTPQRHGLRVSHLFRCVLFSLVSTCLRFHPSVCVCLPAFMLVCLRLPSSLTDLTD